MPPQRNYKNFTAWKLAAPKRTILCPGSQAVPAVVVQYTDRTAAWQSRRLVSFRGRPFRQTQDDILSALGWLNV